MQNDPGQAVTPDGAGLSGHDVDLRIKVNDAHALSSTLFKGFF